MFLMTPTIPTNWLTDKPKQLIFREAYMHNIYNIYEWVVPASASSWIEVVHVMS